MKSHHLFPLLALAVSGVSAAKQPTESELFATSLSQLLNMEIETASGYKQAFQTTAANIVVIDKAQIDARHYRFLLDLLEDLSAFDVQRNVAADQFTRVSVRGIPENARLAIYRNGIRVQDSIGASFAIASNLPIFHADRIEVLVGPAGAIYGSDAAAAIINIITDNNPANRSQALLSVGVEGERHYALNWNFSLLDDWHNQVLLSGYQSPNFDYLDEFASVYGTPDLVNLAGQVVQPYPTRQPVVTPEQSQVIEWFASYKSMEWGVRHAGIEFDSDSASQLALSAYAPQSVVKNNLTNAFARYQHQFGQLQSKTTVEWKRWQIDSETLYINAYSEYQDAFKYGRSIDTAIKQQLQWQVSERWRGVVGAEYKQMSILPRTTDLSSRYDKRLSAQQQSLYYLGTNNEFNAPLNVVEVDNTAAYGQLDYDAAKGLHLSLALRYDDNHRFGSVLNPRLGGAYQFESQDLLKFQYGKATLSPVYQSLLSFGSFAMQNDQQQWVSFFQQRPNPDLKPEQITSAEVAYWSQWHEWQWSAGLYHSKMNQLVVQAQDNEPVQFIADAEIRSTAARVNGGDAITQGGQFSANREFDWLSGQYRFSWSYAYADGELNNQQANELWQMPYVAKHKWHLAIEGRWLDQQLTGFFKTRWVGETPIRLNDQAGRQIDIDAYSVSDIGAQYRLSDHWQLGLTMTNVFDKHYLAASYSAANELRGSPQYLRRMNLSLFAQF